MLIKSKKQTLQPTGAYAKISDLIKTRLFAYKNIPHIAKNKLSLEGETIAKEIGQGMEYAYARKYEYGDDSRHIDWRVSAKKNSTHIKVFHHQFNTPTYIILDQSSSLFFGSKNSFKSVAAAYWASWFAWIYLKQEHPIGAYILNDDEVKHIPPLAKENNVLYILKEFERFNNMLDISKIDVLEKENMLANSLKQLSQNLNKCSNVVIVSDFFGWSIEIEKLLKAINKKISIRLCFIFDILEKDIPQNGFLGFTNGGETIKIDTDIKKNKSMWDSVFEQRKNKINNFCQKNNIAISNVSTDDSVG
jgi:hypothetical protein